MLCSSKEYLNSHLVACIPITIPRTQLQRKRQGSRPPDLQRRTMPRKHISKATAHNLMHSLVLPWSGVHCSTPTEIVVTLFRFCLFEIVLITFPLKGYRLDWITCLGHVRHMPFIVYFGSCDFLGGKGSVVPNAVGQDLQKQPTCTITNTIRI